MAKSLAQQLGKGAAALFDMGDISEEGQDAVW